MAQCNGSQSINPDDENYLPFAPEDDEGKHGPDAVRGAQRMAGGFLLAFEPQSARPVLQRLADLQPCDSEA
eukprot:5481074-Pyramimonas_sp.AAC.1